MATPINIDTTQDGSASGASSAAAVENSAAGGGAGESSGLETSGAGGGVDTSGISQPIESTSPVLAGSSKAPLT